MNSLVFRIEEPFMLVKFCDLRSSSPSLLSQKRLLHLLSLVPLSCCQNCSSSTKELLHLTHLFSCVQGSSPLTGKFLGLFIDVNFASKSRESHIGFHKKVPTFHWFLTYWRSSFYGRPYLDDGPRLLHSFEWISPSISCFFCPERPKSLPNCVTSDWNISSKISLVKSDMLKGERLILWLFLQLIRTDILVLNARKLLLLSRNNHFNIDTLNLFDWLFLRLLIFYLDIWRTFLRRVGRRQVNIKEPRFFLVTDKWSSVCRAFSTQCHLVYRSIPHFMGRRPDSRSRSWHSLGGFQGWPFRGFLTKILLRLLYSSLCCLLNWFYYRSFFHKCSLLHEALLFFLLDSI